MKTLIKFFKTQKYIFVEEVYLCFIKIPGFRKGEIALQRLHKVKDKKSYESMKQIDLPLVTSLGFEKIINNESKENINLYSRHF